MTRAPRPTVDASKTSRSGATKRRVRFVTIAWSDRYLEKIMRYVIPALLAPGNIPALQDRFDCEFVVVTDADRVDTLDDHPTIQRLKRYCRFEARPVDDLITPWYGITLTYAFCRGFVDLGQEMLDTYLFFCNADFIHADGNIATIIDELESGGRKIFCPSYCVVEEEVAPLLDEARTDGNLALSKPKASSIILDHRHPTVKGKTLNTDHDHLHYIDQFYWAIGEDVLLARQMPIALVALHPTMALTEPTVYWDYGIIDDFAPESPDTVLGDSLQSSIIELRELDVAKEEFTPGRPDPKLIGERLSEFYTQYMRRMADYPLMVRRSDVPVAGMEQENASLEAFVRQVMSYEHRICPSKNHPMWVRQKNLLIRHRQDDFIRRQIFNRRNLESIEHRGIYVVVHRSDDEHPYLLESTTRLDHLFHLFFGRFPTAKITNPYWPEFRLFWRGFRDFYRNLNLRLLVISYAYYPATQLILRQKREYVHIPPDYVVHNAIYSAGSFRNSDEQLLDALGDPNRRPFDAAVLELDMRNIRMLNKIVENLRPSLKEGARLSVFTFGFAADYWMERDVAEVVNSLQFWFPGDEVTFRYAGYRSDEDVLPRIAFHSQMQPNYTRTPSGKVRPPLGGTRMFMNLVKALPATLKRNIRTAFTDEKKFPDRCTALLIEITLGPFDKGQNNDLPKDPK